MNLIIHNIKKIRAELIRSSDKKQKDKGMKTIKTFINSCKNVHNHKNVPGVQIVRTAQKGSRRTPIGNLSTGRFRGNGNFSDRKSLGRKQRRSRQNINVKQQTKFATATSVANSVRC